MVDIAGTQVALAIRAGAPKPDIGTADTLKQTVLNAKSIVYADPAKGGAAGVYFAYVIDRLGIADQLKSKTILLPDAQAADTVAKGEAEIGVAQTSEIVPVAGAQILGPLPGEFASTTWALPAKIPTQQNRSSNFSRDRSRSPFSARTASSPDDDRRVPRRVARKTEDD